jgi:hypothetical protein
LALPPSAWSIEGRPASMKSRVENEPVNSTWYWAASCAAGSLAGGGAAWLASHGGVLMNASARASRARPAAVGCAWAAAACRVAAVARAS